jgi:(2S)-methylsuccinyl-CoA dehydrogenase
MTDIIHAAADAITQARVVIERISRHLADKVDDGGRVSTRQLNAIQPEAFELARHLAQASAAESLLAWARENGEHEQSVAALYCAMACTDLTRWTRFNEPSLGLDEHETPVFVGEDGAFITQTLATDKITALGANIIARDFEPAGSYGLGETHQLIQREFSKFSDDRVRPIAEEIHCHDRLIPEDVLQAMGELGVFGVSIPEEYGGSFYDHRTMIIATEELSRGSLGAGGSVITRPEICAKAILTGGSDEQKEYWLPKMASGEVIVSVAVTEPDAGSDVASLKLSAKQTDGGYVLNGEKTWCTFAGRAGLLSVLARTGSADDGHRGLSLFLVEKPATAAGVGDEYAFEHHQDGGGAITGRAIPTIGYRGMHSFSVTFDDYFVPEANRIGDEGRGFYLQMAGFAGGRIQTAARAIGVMEASFREALSYVGDRSVFGHRLAEYSLTRHKLAEMAARIQAGRQLAYTVGTLMDRGQGVLEASLVKFLTCKDAEWVTREAMQLHGGMGYSEEFPVSRYWLDARVLSIFEGAEEVLALMVIARQVLQAVLDKEREA